MVCALFSSFWQCQQQNERKRVPKVLCCACLTEGEGREGVYSYLGNSLSPTGVITKKPKNTAIKYISKNTNMLCALLYVFLVLLGDWMTLDKVRIYEVFPSNEQLYDDEDTQNLWTTSHIHCKQMIFLQCEFSDVCLDKSCLKTSSHTDCIQFLGLYECFDACFG